VLFFLKFRQVEPNLELLGSLVQVDLCKLVDQTRVLCNSFSLI